MTATTSGSPSPGSRAAGYVRVSTEDQARGTSPDGQREAIAERAAKDGFRLVPERLYFDPISGARADRPDYQAMLAAAVAGEFERLYVWKFDRLGRDAEELLRARRMLEAAGVLLVSLTEGEAEGTLIYGVRALVAQEEREKIAERTRMGLEQVAKQGRSTGGQPPLGYRAEGLRRERRFVIEEAEAEIVRRIFGLYLAGEGVNRIAATLNAEGMRTRRGAQFVNRVVAGIIDNPSYIGQIRLKGAILAEDAHEPIIDRETWEAVRSLRASRRAAAGRGVGRNPSGPFLFTKGRLRCGRCGGALGPRRNPQGYEHYACLRRKDYKDCDMPTISRAEVDQSFLDYFETHALDLDGTLAQISAEAMRSIGEARALAASAEAEALKAEAGRERADRAFLDGTIDAEQYQRLSAQAESEREAAQAQSKRLRAQAVALEEEAAALDAEAELGARLGELRQAVAGRIESAEGVSALRAAIDAIFESVTLQDVLGGYFTLFPKIRAEAVSGYFTTSTGAELPKLTPRKVALRLTKEREATAAWPPGKPGRRDPRS